MSTKGLAEFYQEARRDPQLHQQLEGGPRDRESIVPLVLRLGRERGYAFSAEDVEASLAEAAKAAEPDVTGHTVFRVNVDRDEATVVRNCYYLWHSKGFVYRCS
jgi:hypothetical protein